MTWLKNLEKQEQIKPQPSGGQEIIKIKAEMNELEIKRFQTFLNSSKNKNERIIPKLVLWS